MSLAEVAPEQKQDKEEALTLETDEELLVAVI